MTLFPLPHHQYVVNLTIYRESTSPTTQLPQLYHSPPPPDLHTTSLSRAVPSLSRLAAVVAASEHLARVSSVEAAVLNRSGIAIVGVDTREHAAVLGDHALDVDVALALGRALSGGSVNWSNMHKRWLE